MPSLTRKIVPKGDQSKLILREVKRRIKISEHELEDKRDTWVNAENQVLCYIPESEADEGRRRKRSKEGTPSYTTLKLPYTYGVLLSSFTYWSTVFFSRDPVFQFSGRHGEAENQTQALEALIAYQMLVGEIMPPLYSWLYDAGRYGVGIIGSYWDEQINRFTEIDEQPDPETGVMTTVQTTQDMPGYQGNKVWNINPKDFLFDPRGTVRDFQNGEFCGVRHNLSWEQVKRREKLGYYMNVTEIDPNIKPRFQDDYNRNISALERPADNISDSEYADDKGFMKHPVMVPVYEVYIKISPKDWALGPSDYPEIWVFTVTADWKTVIGCSPLGLLHCKYPFDVLEIEADAYALVNRGQPDTLESIQDTMDWLINSHFFNVRASLNNLFVVDPTRVVMKDLTKPSPGGIIRLKPGWDLKQGKPIDQLTVTDITKNNLGDMQLMLGLGERSSGVNDQIMGVLNQAVGRKTATEVRQSSTFGANRLKTTTEYMSATGFTSLAMKLVSNSQQFYDGTKKLKIVGNLAGIAGPGFINVDPEVIAGAYDFIPVDGTLPIDRFAQANLWQGMLANLQKFPQILQQLDMFKLFSWISNLMGLKNADSFRIQVMPQGAGAPPGMVPVAQPPMGNPSGGPSGTLISPPGNGQGLGPIPTTQPSGIGQ